MPQLITLLFAIFTLSASPLQAQVWEEGAEEAQTEGEKAEPAAEPAAEKATETTDGKKEAEPVSPLKDPNPYIIKSNKKYVRDSRLDLAGSFGYTSGTFTNNALGFSFWAVFPSLDEGFLPRINDSFNLEAGIYSEWAWTGYTVIRHKFSFMPSVGGRWNFHLTKKWDVFAAARAGLQILANSQFYPGFAGALGATWQLDEDFALRAELDTRHFLTFGVSFPY